MTSNLPAFFYLQKTKNLLLMKIFVEFRVGWVDFTELWVVIVKSFTKSRTM